MNLVKLTRIVGLHGSSESEIFVNPRFVVRVAFYEDTTRSCLTMSDGAQLIVHECPATVAIRMNGLAPS